MLLLSGILISLNGFSQDKKVILKFSPLALVDEVSFPTIQAGIELSMTKRISWYNEFGIKYRKGYYEKTDTVHASPNGFKAKTEVRYYLNFSKASLLKSMEGFYLAANAFYTRDFHNTGIKYYYRQDSSTARIDNFAVKKTVWGINMLTGIQKSIRKKFMIDFYTGLGIRFRTVLATNIEFDYYKDDLIGPYDLTVQGILNQTDTKGGKETLPNLTLGIRLCYKL